MGLEMIQAWKDRHGTIWETKAEAENSEAGYDIIEYLNANPIYGGSDPVDGQAFWLWLRENPRVYVKILNDTTSEE